MSASLKSTVATRQAKRHAVAERKRLAAVEARKRDEARDELIAPRSQRMPVLGRDGIPIRGARIERDGCCFVRSNPVRHMVARSRHREAPLITKKHS
ncbi:MAG: hypothetical protein WBR21_17915, partial [Rouxiella badensis]|uniref:hypothetical protein n=1 Tax=Rouxiella badensis TaxID=1646377 RepID=UPI003C346C4C